jgi:hypothetical protein
MSKPRCNEPGCTKQAWKQGKCFKHWHEHDKRQASKETQPDTQPLPELPAEAAASVALPLKIEESPRSLLQLTIPPPPPEPLKEGFFLDFTGYPGLLTDLEAVSDDVPGDILELCSLLVQGKLHQVKQL